jgi:predicted hydrocarbon binding protein
MKGIIFNLLESFVCEGWGEQTYEEVLERCRLRTREPFIGPGTYPDADLVALVSAVTERLDIKMDDALHAFGKYAFAHLVRKFPMFVQGHSHPKTFLKTIDDVIHVEVKKFLRDADPPHITFRDPAPDELVLIYDSRRRMCTLAAGLVDGCAQFFAVPIECREIECARTGAATCTFHLRFPTGGPS